MQTTPDPPPARRAKFATVSVGLLSALLLAGCSAAAAPQGGAGQAGEQAVQVSLGQCAASQRAIAQAIHQNNTAVILRSLEEGRLMCAAAAADIRKSPSARIDSAAEAAALDQMSGGLQQVIAGLHAMEQNPKQGSATIDAGMQVYVDGVARLKRANS
jgi:hypothetical protein